MNVKPLLTGFKATSVFPSLVPVKCPFKRKDAVRYIGSKENVRSNIRYNRNCQSFRTRASKINKSGINYGVPPKEIGYVQEVTVNPHTKKIFIHCVFDRYIFRFSPEMLELVVDN